MRDVLKAAGGAVFLIFMAASCAGKPASGEETVNIGSLFEPNNLSNTSGAGQGINEAFNGNVYEGLFRLADSGEVEPLLAEEWTVSEDRLRYKFRLRGGVKFHSGKDFSAADVKASFERVVAGDSQAARKSTYAVVDSIEIPDPRTVIFQLKKPSVSLPYYLSYIWIVNTEAGDLKAAEDGTGPYTLENWTRGSSLSLTRFEDYWGEKAKNARAVFYYFTDAMALNNALLSGQVDIITSVQSPDALSVFENNKKFVISSGNSTTKELLAFNDQWGPFNSVLARKAVYSAIDRAKLLNAIWGKYGTLIGSMVPPTDPWYDAALVNENPYDAGLAKTLLAEAGYPDGFAFTLETPAYDPHPAVAEFIQSELAKVGITVSINSITADEWYSKVFREKNFEATLQEHVNDRDVVWYGNPNFYWGYKNAEVTRLVDEAESSATPEEQKEKLLQVNRIIAKEAASAWLYLYPQIIVASAKLSGYPVNALNSQFFAYNIVKAK
ncbi:MAG: ABC transporter substrate-binding protein [Spirochaetaceae bacterium]|jgi:peptide/nickel transport system substrate-binding protein|nr:ABC transporter substrate-binding protein [Spirochaetaceae bacterium]